MAVQKSKKSRSHRDIRRFAKKSKLPQLSVESTTGEVHLRHHISAQGFYRGESIKKPVEVEAE
jgi:large subunit ribosomal protein L32